MCKVHDMNIWKSKTTQHFAQWRTDNNRNSRWRNIGITGESQFDQSV